MYKIIIFSLCWSLAMATLKCEDCAANEQKFYLNVSGSLTCGEPEHKVIFTATTPMQCKLLESLIAKLNLKKTNFISKPTTAAPTAAATTTEMSATENMIITASIPTIPIAMTTTITTRAPAKTVGPTASTTMEKATTQRMIIPIATAPALPVAMTTTITTTAPTQTAAAVSTTAMDNLKRGEEEVNHMNSTAIIEPNRNNQTMAECQRTAKSGEDRLDRIWRSVARSFILIERARKRNVTLPTELTVWNLLNPLPQMVPNVEQFHKEKLKNKRNALKNKVC